MNPRAKTIRFEALRFMGCYCCEANMALGYSPSCMPVEVHHLNAGALHGGKRLGDEFTIPLCSWHHRGVLQAGYWTKDMRKVFGPSWAGGSKPFRIAYGSDDSILAQVNERLRILHPDLDLGAAA
jgi:hypothetical protein